MSSAPPVTAVGLNAKHPEPGRVKTRLCPPLSPSEAAEFYEAILLDLAGRLEQLADIDLVLFYDPPGAERWFRTHLGPRWHLVPQDAGDLGRRLDAEARWLAGRGYAAYALLGSDAPTLPLAAVRQALAETAAGREDMILGPDQAGGYYLVAMRNHCPGIFENVAWGGPRSLADTEANAKRAGLRVARTVPWFDVDAGPDLARLQRDLAQGGPARELPRTSRWFRQHPPDLYGRRLRP